MIVSLTSALMSLTMMQQAALVHPEAPSAKPPKAETAVTLATPPPKPAKPNAGNDPRTGKPPAKTALGPTDYAYEMPEGVACYGKVFYPKGYDAKGKTPAVVLGQGWAGTHVSIEKYAAARRRRGAPLRESTAINARAAAPIPTATAARAADIARPGSPNTMRRRCVDTS